MPEGTGGISETPDDGMLPNDSELVFTGIIEARAASDADPDAPGIQGTDDRFGGNYAVSDVYQLVLNEVLSPESILLFGMVLVVRGRFVWAVMSTMVRNAVVLS